MIIAKKFSLSPTCLILCGLFLWTLSIFWFVNNNQRVQSPNLSSPQQAELDKPHQFHIVPTWEGCDLNLPDLKFRKHITPPPKGLITLVCCNTTKGPLNIEVHHAWAPIGADRFVYMVKDNFFSTNIALFRALKGFLIQFGIAGDPKVHKRYHELGNLKDDPPWLPLGPPGREINGTKRFQKGYLAYAGAGKNSRGTQLIVALEDNLYLGGGSPWEVPFGQVFGEKSFHTLANIYTGYGEKPSQGKLMNQGEKYIRKEFPLIDFITKCMITKENLTDLIFK